MTSTVQVGTILIADRPAITQLLGLTSEQFSGKWCNVQGLDGFALDRKIHAAGCNFLFMAGEVKASFLGFARATNLRRALQRILVKSGPQSFNCLEVTGIVARRFLGIRYTTVSAHSRHIQSSCYLDGAEIRRASQQDAEWANG
jgi:hypothetical protein